MLHIPDFFLNDPIVLSRQWARTINRKRDGMKTICGGSGGMAETSPPFRHKRHFRHAE